MFFRENVCNSRDYGLKIKMFVLEILREYCTQSRSFTRDSLTRLLRDRANDRTQDCKVSLTCTVKVRN